MTPSLKRFTFIASTFIFLLLSDVVAKTWTFKDGRVFEGEYVYSDGKILRFVDTAGEDTTYQCKVSQLIEADQNYVLRLYQHSKKKEIRETAKEGFVFLENQGRSIKMLKIDDPILRYSSGENYCLVFFETPKAFEDQVPSNMLKEIYVTLRLRGGRSLKTIVDQEKERKHRHRTQLIEEKQNGSSEIILVYEDKPDRGIFHRRQVEVFKSNGLHYIHISAICDDYRYPYPQEVKKRTNDQFEAILESLAQNNRPLKVDEMILTRLDLNSGVNAL